MSMMVLQQWAVCHITRALSKKAHKRKQKGTNESSDFRDFFLPKASTVWPIAKTITAAVILMTN